MKKILQENECMHSSYQLDLKLCNDKGTMYSPFAQFHLNIFEPFFFSPAAESSSDNDPPSTDSEDHAAPPDLLLMDQAHDEYEQKQELRKVSAIY